MSSLPGVTRSRLAADLTALGLARGGVAIVHTRMRALGWVAGGSEAVVRALLDAVGPAGTLLAYLSWQEQVYDEEERPPGQRAAYRADPPVFHAATAEAMYDVGRLPERLRTWPGAVTSDHPEARVVALGPRAAWLCALQPANDAYGAESPFARLVAADGQVVMLGAPLDTITLLHHAEAIAEAPKRRRAFRVRVATGTGVEERAYRDIDTSGGAYDYERLALGADPFAVIGEAALAAGIGTSGPVGASRSHVFPARALTAFAVDWLESRFG